MFQIIGGLLALVVVVLAIGVGLLMRGPVPLDTAGPTIKTAFAEAFAPLSIEFINPTLVWSGEARAFQLRLDQVEIFDAENGLVADVPRAEIGISADGLMRGLVAPSRIEFIGATALLIRRQDGGIQLGLSTPEGDRGSPRSLSPARDETLETLETLGIVQSILSLLLEPPDGRTRGDYLTAFVIRDSTLRFFDARTNSFWRAPNGFLAFARGEDGLSMRLDADVEVGGRKWSLDLSGTFDPVDGRGAVAAQFSDFNPSHVASAVPALGWLQGIDVPIEGAVALEFTEAGEVLSADLSIIVGSGEFGLPGYFDEPLPVDSAAFVGEFRPREKSAEIRQFTYRAGENHTSISGRVRVETAEDDPWRPVAINLDVAASELSVFVPSLQGSPVVYDHAELNGRVDILGRTITIRNFEGQTQGGEVALSGSISDATGELEIFAQASVSAIPTSQILAYWPEGRAPGARNWIGSNLRSGVVRNMEFRIDAPAGTFATSPLSNDVLELSFEFDEGVSTFVPGLPVMTEGRGFATLYADQFDLTLEHGMIGDIVIQGAHMLVDQMHVRGTPGIFNVDVEGPVAQILELLDSGPFDFPSRYGIVPRTVGGSAVGTVEIILPMLSNPPRDRISYAAQAEIEGITMPEAAPAVDLTDGTLSLQLERSGLRARGEVELNGVPLDFGWRENFEDPTAPSMFTVSGILSDSDRIRLGLDFGSAVSGPVDVDITTQGRGRELRAVNIRADLGEATVLIPNTNWIKPAGEIAAARLQLVLPDEGGLEVRDLIFAGDRALIRGGFALGANGRLEFAELERIRLDGLIDVSLFARRDDMNALRVEVDGEYFNAAPFMRQFTRAQDQGPGLPFVVEGSVGTLTMLSDVEVKNVEFYLLNDGDRILEMDIVGGFEAGGIVRSSMTPRADATRDFLVTSSNAGELMNGLLGFESIYGGNLVLSVKVRDQPVEVFEQGSGEEPMPEVSEMAEVSEMPEGSETPEITPPPDVPTSPEARRTRGLLTIDQFRVVGAPALAQLLSLGSLQGLADTLSGEGIAFQTLELPFYAEGGLIGFEEGRAHGSALGLTLNGEIDRDEGMTNLTGTIVPAYSINSFLGNVPVLGEIFVSREGEGVIAFTYGISGPTDNPQIFVNPLSALTPGLFRRIFSGNPFQTLPQQTTPTEDSP